MTPQSTHRQDQHMAALEIKIDHYHETPAQWLARPPVNITCAAVALSDQPNTLVHTNTGPDGYILEHLTQGQVTDFIRQLAHLQQQGYRLVSWNGTSFDLQTAADVTELHDQCAAIAIDHWDILFQIFCNVGWPVGLRAAALAMGTEHQLPDTGDINLLWPDPELRPQMVELAAQHAQAALEVAQAAQRERSISWLSQNDQIITLPLPEGLLTVSEAMTLPLPDTSWMRKPLTRHHFTKWLPVQLHRVPAPRQEPWEQDADEDDYETFRHVYEQYGMTPPAIRVQHREHFITWP